MNNSISRPINQENIESAECFLGLANGFIYDYDDGDVDDDGRPTFIKVSIK